MSFRPLQLSLGQGLAQDLSNQSLQMPEGMQGLTNVVFTRKGAITGRPGAVTHDEQTQDSPAGGALVPLTSATAVKLRSGVVPVNTPDGERPLAMWQGGQYVYTGSAWTRVGAIASARKYTSKALGVDLLLRGAGGAGGHVAPIPAGTNVVGLLSPGMERGGIPYLGTTNEIQYYGTAATTSIDAAGQANMAAAGNALFYHTTAGDVRVHLPGGLPTTSDVLIAAAVARTDTTPRMNMAAVLETGGAAYFIAWVSATAGRVSLRRINSAGAVTATLDVNGLGTVLGVSLGISTGNRLILGLIDSATATLKTKIFTTTAVAITDAAIDVNYSAGTVSTAGAHSFSFAVGVSHLGTGLVAYLSTAAHMLLQERSMTAVTTNLRLTLYGSAADGVSWEPLFNPVVIGPATAPITVIGIQRTVPSFDFGGGTSDYNVGQSQWYALNLTHLLNTSVVASSNYRGIVMAHGQWRGNARSKPTQPGLPTVNSLAFGLWEGTTFDTLGTASVRAVRVVLELSPSAGARHSAGALLSTANAAFFDGTALYQHPFPESYPDIVGLNNVAGGLTGGSYTYQATWEMTNALGQVVRSGASEPYTLVVAAAKKTQVIITVPQLLDYRTNHTAILVKLWATVVNPSAGAALYFVAAAQQALPTSGTVTLEHTLEVDLTQPQLYTSGNVMDDAPPPAGDRGVALASERLWVADQTHVYASKLLDHRYGPSWNTDGLHVVEIPGALGDIQGLAGYDDRLVVTCGNGVAIVRGPGYDDLGDGPGWATDVYTGFGASNTSPRRTSATQEGVVYEGTGGSLWLVDAGGNRTRVNMPVSLDVADSAGGGDVSHGGGNVEPLTNTYLQPRRLYHGHNPFFVFDYDAGMWATWVIDTIDTPYHTVINGYLWLQGEGYMVSVDNAPGTDSVNGNANDIVMAFQTGSIQPADSYASWGRLRKIQLTGPHPPIGNPLTITVSVYGDDSTFLLFDTEAYTPVAADGLWPRLPYPEFTTSVQRCRTFRVAVSITPAVVELTSLVAWVSGGGAAPNDNRG